MDRSVVLPLLGLLLIIVVLVDTLSLNWFSERWKVDTTASLVNKGEGSIRDIITPPETRIVEYEGRSVILLDSTTATSESMLFAENRFRNALAAEERLILYTSDDGVSAVIASPYFNEAEVKMLSTDERVLGALKSAHTPGVKDISYIDAWDPTNAKIETVAVGTSWVTLLVPYYATSENLSFAKESVEFNKVVEGSMKVKEKSLLLYHPSKGGMNVVIPLNFTDTEVRMLAKNTAVKTALDTIEVDAGRAVKLEETREFENINLASLPYKPDTEVYVSLNIRGELGFLSEDILIYLAIFVVILVMLYVLYTILMT